MRRAVGALALLAAVSCGSSGTPAGRALHDTAKHLDDLRSARLDLRMTAESPAAKGPVGFALSGPFAMPAKQGLPVADLKVTELRGRTSSTVSFVSTGQRAYVVRDGRAMALSPDAGVSLGGGEGFGTLRIDGWLRDPSMADGGTVDGVATDRISAGLDTGRAFDDLGRLGQRLGVASLAGLRPLDADARKQLDQAARDSRIEVWTGHDDRMLRRLVLTVTLAGDVPESLKSMVPVTMRLSLDLADVNRPVHVEAPAT